ncbi:MAG: serine hydrolase [Streptosporangiaceae bacterium]
MTLPYRGRLTRDGLARFEEIAGAHVADGGVPGLVALAGTCEEAHVEAHGVLGFGGRPVRRDSLFRISATTKPITGALILTLVREGLLALDEPVDRLLPELANRRVLRRMDGPLDDTVPSDRPVTVRDLLGTTWLVDPARDLVVIVLTQRMFGGPGAVPAVHADLQEAAFDALPESNA